MADTIHGQLKQAVRVLQTTTGTDQFYVEYAYGRPRLHYRLKNGGSQEISPRLPARQLTRWIEAFISGYEIGHGDGAAKPRTAQ